jgi:hypothetical protein
MSFCEISFEALVQTIQKLVMAKTVVFRKNGQIERYRSPILIPTERPYKKLTMLKLWTKFKHLIGHAYSFSTPDLIWSLVVHLSVRLLHCRLLQKCWANFNLSWLKSSLGDRAANFGLCSAVRAFEQGEIVIVPHLLRHGTSVYMISSKRPAPTS